MGGRPIGLVPRQYAPPKGAPGRGGSRPSHHPPTALCRGARQGPAGHSTSGRGSADEGAVGVTVRSAVVGIGYCPASEAAGHPPGLGYEPIPIPPPFSSRPPRLTPLPAVATPPAQSAPFHLVGRRRSRGPWPLFPPRQSSCLVGGRLACAGARVRRRPGLTRFSGVSRGCLRQHGAPQWRPSRRRHRRCPLPAGPAPDRAAGLPPLAPPGPLRTGRGHGRARGGRPRPQNP